MSVARQVKVTLNNVPPWAKIAEVAVVEAPWPWWAKGVRMLRSPDDIGVGDTIAREIGPIGGDAFKAWSKRIGFHCGCEQRQEVLNKRYPYVKKDAFSG